MLLRWANAFHANSVATVSSRVALALIAQPNADVLSVPSSVCSSGAIRGAFRSNYTTCALSSSAFMDSCPPGFSHVRNDSRRC